MGWAKSIAIGFIASALVTSVPAPAFAVGPYEQPVFFEWDRTELDVLVVPPQHGQIFNGSGNTRLLNDGDPNELNPLATSYLKAFDKAVADWRSAIKKFGSASVRRLKLNVYVLGRDIAPAAALREPEIVIVWDEAKGTLLGRASRFWVGSTSTPCIIDVSQFFTNSFSYPDMYNIAGHEFGHCLGLDHTKGDKVIDFDIMHGTYMRDVGFAETPLNCPSNLNVKGLDLAYDGKPATRSLQMPSTAYKKIACQ